MLRVHQWCKLGEQHAAHGSQITLPLKHAREASQVRLQPVLLGVAIRSQSQVVDHRVDVVFQLCDFAAGFDLNRTGQIALGDGRCDLRDGSDLVRQVVGQQVYVTREVLPRACGARDVGLTAESSFHTNFAGDGGHLIGKRGESTGHVVDGFREGRDFALCIHCELLG